MQMARVSATCMALAFADVFVLLTLEILVSTSSTAFADLLVAVQQVPITIDNAWRQRVRAKRARDCHDFLLRQFASASAAEYSIVMLHCFLLSETAREGEQATNCTRRRGIRLPKDSELYKALQYLTQPLPVRPLPWSVHERRHG
jgi:hypothetical protein